MEDVLNDYLTKVIGKGDKDSKLISKLTAPTVTNCKYVKVITEGMNGVAVLKNLPMDYDVVVYTVGGDPKITDSDRYRTKNLARYTASMVDRLMTVAEYNNFIPLAFADVVDASVGDKKDIITIGNTLCNVANKYNLAVLNGETAILGPIVNGIASINGTMIALAKKGSVPGNFFVDGLEDPVHVASFSHNGKPVYTNSDGEGTKSEFEVRTKTYPNSLLNSAAMKLDDLIKIGAEAKVVSDLVQTRGNIPINDMREFAVMLSKEFGIQYILQHEIADNRLMGYNLTAPAFNISGSSVSLIDEDRLNNPLKPSEGEYLIAIRGHPNPRSNGITDKRKLMIAWLGENYHETELGKEFLQYLAAPSIVFYPHFKKLIDGGLVTSVYHMSGGAYNGKLARPLAKHGLFASLNHNLFQPDYRELELMKRQNVGVDVAYAKWPMGNDGFVTTSRPNEVIYYLESVGLEVAYVATIEKDKGGRTGVELTAFNGEKVYFNGIDKKK